MNFRLSIVVVTIIFSAMSTLASPTVSEIIFVTIDEDSKLISLKHFFGRHLKGVERRDDCGYPCPGMAGKTGHCCG